jgi:hypothetical protein
MALEFDTGKIEYSWKDKKKGIILPKYLSEDLAYLVGVHIGDGSMGIYRRPRQVEYKQAICGHEINDKVFYLEILIPIFKKLFNFCPKTRVNSPGCCSIYFTSKAVTTYFNRCLNLPLGKKSKIVDIPEIIKKSNLKFQFACLRGIFDTDFVLSFKNKNQTKHNYPVIELKNNSQSLRDTISNILTLIGFSHSKFETIVEDPRFKKPSHEFALNISGKENLDKWFSIIGSRNPSYLSRYAVYKKFGFCPPNTNYLERKAMLLGKLDPYSYY